MSWQGPDPAMAACLETADRAIIARLQITPEERAAVEYFVWLVCDCVKINRGILEERQWKDSDWFTMNSILVNNLSPFLDLGWKTRRCVRALATISAACNNISEHAALVELFLPKITGLVFLAQYCVDPHRANWHNGPVGAEAYEWLQQVIGQLAQIDALTEEFGKFAKPLAEFVLVLRNALCTNFDHYLAIPQWRKAFLEAGSGKAIEKLLDGVCIQLSSLEYVIRRPPTLEPAEETFDESEPLKATPATTGAPQLLHPNSAGQPGDTADGGGVAGLNYGALFSRNGTLLSVDADTREVMEPDRADVVKVVRLLDSLMRERDVAEYMTAETKVALLEAVCVLAGVTWGDATVREVVQDCLWGMSNVEGLRPTMRNNLDMICAACLNMHQALPDRSSSIIAPYSPESIDALLEPIRMLHPDAAGPAKRVRRLMGGYRVRAPTSDFMFSEALQRALQRE